MTDPEVREELEQTVASFGLCERCGKPRRASLDGDGELIIQCLTVSCQLSASLPDCNLTGRTRYCTINLFA